MIRVLGFLVICAGVGYGCLWAGERGAAYYEALLAERLRAGLAATSLDWVEPRIDGLRVELHGHAPDIYANELALATARSVLPMVEVIDYSSAELAPPEPRRPVAVELHREGGRLTLTGRMHAPATRARLIRAIEAEAPGLALESFLGLDAARPEPPLGAEIRVAALAVARLHNARVQLAPGRVQIAGTLANPEGRTTLTEAFLARAGQEVKLELDLVDPPRVITPFRFRATKSGDDSIAILDCAARSADEAGFIADLLVRRGLADHPGDCPSGLGGPRGDWPGAIAAGLAALARIPAGDLAIDDRWIRLTGRAPTRKADLDAAMALLRAHLPERFEARAARSPGADAGTVAPYWLRLERGPERIVVAGRVQGEAAAHTLETLAAAEFPGHAIASGVTAGSGSAPPGWQAARRAAIAALGRLKRGRIRLSAGRLDLDGALADPAAAGRLHRALERRLPEWRISTAIEIDLPAQVAALPVSATRCAHLLNRLVQLRPIGFAPGSAVIEDADSWVLDRLAGILRRCPEAVIEIGGHTDSQGSAGFNMRLSRARAEAVLEALLGRGIPLANLLAEGYGETEPIASNRRAAGRERNRRIAFRAMEAKR